MEPEAADLRFQALLEAAPDAIVCVDGEGRIVLVNSQTECLFAYERSELIGQPVEALVPDSRRAAHAAHRAAYMPDPKPRPMGARTELAGRRSDGSEFPAEISLSMVDGEEGLLVVAAIRDVTDRKRAADAQAQLASIVQSSHDAIVGKSLGGVITSWNPAAEKLYGYSSREIIGKSIDVLVPPELRDQERENVKRIARGDHVEQQRTTRVRKDGGHASVMLTLSPIADAAGQIVGAASIARDLSETQRAEAKFLGLLEAAPDAIIGVDGEGRIALANAQAQRLFGYTREELVGQEVEVLVPDAARGVHPRHRSTYFANPVSRPMGAGMQLAARRKDGSEFPAEISLSAIETEGGVLVSAAIRDVTERLEAQAERERLRTQTERQALERQLHQSQRLESLGQLAGGVAHDFNNLLGVILNYATFVSQEVDARTSGDGDAWEPVRGDLAEIQKAADRAVKLTHQLLAFGRREVVQPVVLSVNDVIRDIERLLRRTLGEHIELVTNLSDDLWAVMADPGQLEQVLVNLAVNARDVMPAGGKLVLESQNVTVDEDYVARRPALSPGHYARLRVSDTGSGMERRVIERAFEPFFTTKPKGEGSGLGLATVYGIVKQAGGDVEIYSELGLGTTFSIVLPASDALAVAGADPVPVVAGTGGETVLVVEDEDAMRELTRRILVRNGYDVIVAEGGWAAIQAALKHAGSIDLLVTDVVMPQMLGKEVSERVLAVRPDVRVLFMSGYAEPILTTQGTLPPGVSLVEKPFSEPQLLAKVREVLDSSAEAP